MLVPGLVCSGEDEVCDGEEDTGAADETEDEAGVPPTADGGL